MDYLKAKEKKLFFQRSMKDIHVLIKTVECKDVLESMVATARKLDHNRNTEYAKRGKYVYNNMLSYLIHKDYCNINMPREVLTTELR